MFLIRLPNWFSMYLGSDKKNFSIEESKENDLIIKAATGNIKTRTIRNLLFSLTLQVVRINNQGAPLLGLAKSICYIVINVPTRG